MMAADAVRCMRRASAPIIDINAFVVVADTTLGRSDMLTRFCFIEPDVTIDWGDGTIEVITGSGVTYAPHTYMTHGIYTIQVTGAATSMRTGGYLSAITDCLSFGEVTSRPEGAFNNAINLISVPDTLPASVTSVKQMFYGASAFNQDISAWDVSGVEDMSYMFQGASAFNQDISVWDTANVRLMTSMFKDAAVFNQNLSVWCVSKISSEPFNFSVGSPLQPANKPVWGTCPA